MLKTNIDTSGAVHSEYYLGNQHVLSDVQNHDAQTRIRTLCDGLGRVVGKRKDFPDGSSVSEFINDGRGLYRIARDRKGITVMKNADGKWMRITDQQECSHVLSKDRLIFAPPPLPGQL
jgi:hypothetical protein